MRPTGITFDKAENMYVIERGAVLRVDANSSVVTTIAGITGSFGSTGDGGAATRATFSIETTSYDSGASFPYLSGGLMYYSADTIPTPKGKNRFSWYLS